MINDAERLIQLFQTDARDQDEFWLDRLNSAFWPARLGSFTPPIVVDKVMNRACYRLGQDEHDGGEIASPPAGLVDWAIEKGMGFVYWPTGEPQPLWEFRLGDVLSYRLYGTSFAPRFWNAPVADQEEAITREEQVWVGAPSEQMFPPVVREAVRRMMKEKLGIREPKVMLLHREKQASHLVFGLGSDELSENRPVSLAHSMIQWCVPSCIPMYRIDQMTNDPAMAPF